MSESLYRQNRQQLQQLMQKVGITSLKQLSERSGVSELQLNRLLYGLLPKIQVENLLKLATALQVSISELVKLFVPTLPLESIPPSEPKKTQAKEEAAALTALKQEYQLLQQQLAQQQQSLEQEFQKSSLEVLEPWLLQWPTAAALAQKHQQLSASKLVPLAKPIEQLLHKWGVEAIAAIGDEVPYNPQYHDLIEGTAQSGDMVKVRYIGYRQGDKLLYRAKVSPLHHPEGTS